MRIRPANWADIDRCTKLDGSYTTNYVWQMDESVVPHGVDVSFRRIRLPRPLEVAYPRSVEDLQADKQRNECFLVADELGGILAYIDMTVRHWQWQGHIEHLVVHRSYRRQGIATRLLLAAEHWARGSNLSAITVALQNKNDPAITLLTQRGYRFCGFAEYYYHNDDIAMFYSLSLGTIPSRI